MFQVPRPYQGFCRCIGWSVSLLFNVNISNGDLNCWRMMISAAFYHGDKVICWFTGFIFQTFVQQYEAAVFPTFPEGFPLQMLKNASHAPSFVVKVSCYKSSGSILNFFELILNAYAWEVLNRTAVFQERAHQCSVCCLFYLLWTIV